ncbi:acyl-CoA thioesterase/bile acid-CoA:amino acid N-acyltransferase family protein [Umezawaea beigongshangensis]|uniref:acyl-CoA thioesterase/bile acid-CoA:amino acid N-acyltransferase family protein n=1 Tax=Umezawaea beigongshangensis TaxID=2780383 RepID=UPI0018F232CB|nr:acyl-CoA thioesterase/bile acid-CoA:amino acid N-acyltransferase family protein [Umezawaea beigongshangensis]
MAEILVAPRNAPLDRTLDVRLTGLPPDAAVVVRATADDAFGRSLLSEGVFRSDERGVVDLTRHAPVRGSWSGVDASGLFWSMVPSGRAGDSGGRKGKLPPVVTTITGEVDGKTVAETVVDRLRLPENVQRTKIRENGLVGTLFSPRKGGPRPGVLLLGGSEGGLHELDAALLAGHGFTVLALAYFGTKGLPEHLVDVPLEYFGDAVDLLDERCTSVGVLGGSRGGEAALLIAATYPQVTAVASVVGSGVVTQGIPAGATLLSILSTESASWTHGGEALPYLPYSVPEELRHGVVQGDPIPLGLAFDLSDGVPEDVEIPVERINGAVLLISGEQDASWPSAELSRVAERRLAEHDHPHRHEHVSYPGAGHLIAGPPFRPTTEVEIPGPGVTFFTGGTPAANAAAQADAWQRIVRFFSAELAA